MDEPATFIGLDVHKATVSVGIAEDGRAGEVRFLGEIPNRPTAVARLVEELAKRHPGQLSFCYEAGPCGYALHRQLMQSGHDCSVVAPALVPVRPGDHVKTDRRDALALARLRRAGELVAVWIVLQEYIDTIADAEQRRDRLTAQLEQLLP